MNAYGWPLSGQKYRIALQHRIRLGSVAHYSERLRMTQFLYDLIASCTGVSGCAERSHINFPNMSERSRPLETAPATLIDEEKSGERKYHK